MGLVHTYLAAAFNVQSCEKYEKIKTDARWAAPLQETCPDLLCWDQHGCLQQLQEQL